MLAISNSDTQDFANILKTLRNQILEIILNIQHFNFIAMKNLLPLFVECSIV